MALNKLKIGTVKDLIAFMKKDEEDFEEEIFKKNFRISPSTTDVSKIENLHKLIADLPEGYIDSLKEFNLLDVLIGHFAISPIGYGVKDIVESIEKAQSDESIIPRKILDKFGLFWVGNNNDYTVHVAGKKSCFPEDEVWLIDGRILTVEEEEYPQYMWPLAPNFELFLLGAANLNLTHRKLKKSEGDEGACIKDFLAILSSIGISEKYHEGWLLFV